MSNDLRLELPCPANDPGANETNAAALRKEAPRHGLAGTMKLLDLADALDALAAHQRKHPETARDVWGVC